VELLAGLVENVLASHPGGDGVVEVVQGAIVGDGVGEPGAGLIRCLEQAGDKRALEVADQFVRASRSA
jgi:hypothetical protein